MALKTLEEYKASLPPLQAPEKSGVTCPECSGELSWDSESLFLKNPPMRRLICHECGNFTEVVRIHK